MKRIGLVTAIVLIGGLLLGGTVAPVLALVVQPSVDTISKASGKTYYDGYYTEEELIEYLRAGYPYPFSVTVATTNEDGSPNLSVINPGISECGNYLAFGMEENRTGVNFVERKLAVVSFYEYNPPEELDPENPLATGDRGCRVIVQYPGDETNGELNEGRRRPAIFMEIIEVLPLG